MNEVVKSKRVHKNPKRVKALELLATGKLDAAAIAEAVGCDRLFVSKLARQSGIKLRCVPSPNRPGCLNTIEPQKSISDTRLTTLYGGRRYDDFEVRTEYRLSA